MIPQVWNQQCKNQHSSGIPTSFISGGNREHWESFTIFVLRFCAHLNEERFEDRAHTLLPDISALIPLVGSITQGRGDVDGIERALDIMEELDDFVFTAICEE